MNIVAGLYRHVNPNAGINLTIHVNISLGGNTNVVLLSFLQYYYN